MMTAYELLWLNLFRNKLAAGIMLPFYPFRNGYERNARRSGNAAHADTGTSRVQGRASHGVSVPLDPFVIT